MDTNIKLVLNVTWKVYQEHQHYFYCLSFSLQVLITPWKSSHFSFLIFDHNTIDKTNIWKKIELQTNSKQNNVYGSWIWKNQQQIISELLISCSSIKCMCLPINPCFNCVYRLFHVFPFFKFLHLILLIQHGWSSSILINIIYNQIKIACQKWKKKKIYRDHVFFWENQSSLWNYIFLNCSCPLNMI